MSKVRVKGKKIRGQDFYNTLYVLAAVAGTSFLLASILPPRYMPGILAFAISFLIYSPIWLLISKKVLCVFTEDRLYYYGMEFAVVSGKKRKVLSDVGSVLFTEITDYEYLPGTRSFRVPPRVVLYGANFELTISGAGRHLIRQLEKAQMACIGRKPVETSVLDAPDTQTVQHDRHGLWKEIWKSFETGALENMLGAYTIRLMEGNESLDVIDIAVEHNGQEIAFNMDESSIYLYAVNTEKTQTITYEQLSGLEALFSAMREFIESNS